MTKQKRISALMFAAVLCFAMLFSAFFISAEAHHDCSGADCLICECVAVCESTLKTVGVAISAAVCLTAVQYILFSAEGAIASDVEAVTLVSLKVKLSD